MSQEKKQSKGNSKVQQGAEKILTNAQRIVSSAVGVLEEEIAAGILAAKRLENKLIKVDEVRENQDELMNRIRRDTHEAVDLFLDAFAALTHQLNAVIDKSKLSTENASSKNDTPATNIAQPVFLEADRVYQPGEIAEFQLIFSDDTNSKISLIKTDFKSNQNSLIAASNVTVKPVSITLKPKEKAEVKISVRIPKTTIDGTYRAIFADKYNGDVSIFILLKVQN